MRKIVAFGVAVLTAVTLFMVGRTMGKTTYEKAAYIKGCSDATTVFLALLGARADQSKVAAACEDMRNAK